MNISFSFVVESVKTRRVYVFEKCKETCVHGRQPGQLAQTHHSGYALEHEFTFRPFMQTGPSSDHGEKWTVKLREGIEAVALMARLGETVEATVQLPGAETEQIQRSQNEG